MPASRLDQLVALAKRRGFIFQGSAIYGGLQGTYDYGPMGVELKNNLMQRWWKDHVHARSDVYGLDASILTHAHTLKHSGHCDTFVDPMVDCRQCKARLRADHVRQGRCDHCGSQDLTEPRPFNLMFKTQVGPLSDDASTAYLRPETAQSVFTNFKHVADSMSATLPFGIAQMGKAFRNEITPRNFIFRVREFEQMELEFFCKAQDADQWHAYWIKKRMAWWQDQGLSPDYLEAYVQQEDELSHYAKGAVDIMYRFPHGLEELEGIANRQDYDLASHSKNQQELAITSNVKLNNDSTAQLALKHPSYGPDAIVPFVIEPSAGVDRGVLALLSQAYHEESIDDGKQRVVLKLKPHLSPIKAAIMPLAKNNQTMISMAKQLKAQLSLLDLGPMAFENTGNIGKNYRRHDEIGTPFCITVDFDSIGQSSGNDQAMTGTVTLRNRDTRQQQRMNIDALISTLKSELAYQPRMQQASIDC